MLHREQQRALVWARRVSLAHHPASQVVKPPVAEEVLKKMTIIPVYDEQARRSAFIEEANLPAKIAGLRTAVEHAPAAQPSPHRPPCVTRMRQAAAIRADAYLSANDIKSGLTHLSVMSKRLGEQARLLGNQAAVIGPLAPKKALTEDQKLNIALGTVLASDKPKGAVLQQKSTVNREFGVVPGSVTAQGRLHLAAMLGDTPRTGLSDGEVDKVARLVLSQAAKNKCQKTVRPSGYGRRSVLTLAAGRARPSPLRHLQAGHARGPPWRRKEEGE